MNGQTGLKPSNAKMVRRYFAVWQEEIAKDKGERLAAQVMEIVQTSLDSLYINCQRPPHPALQIHLANNILPALALYQVLREQGQDEQMALETVERLYRAAAQARRKQLQLIGRLPFVFQFYRLTIRQLMNKDYPSEGWDAEWMEVSSQTVAFNMHRCFYLDTLTSYGAAELTPVFCSMDDFLYGNMSSYISWGRTKTLGRGNDCCDFRFSRTTSHKA